ncbi:unnamed protein product [[Candida] boidinii]|uniref:Unnamed protein product n=1 Tax=Candida boidinii TaxID=5477 RepID=A0A9W6WFM9_CANBO|nr:hypothetical protein B5S30_g7 [[Candida] boidinii]OWB81993.1 hypothetical protein B5S33_g614 [[Candida] boidinii]GME67405.1 unnamed protein product [[Candida] boidinii]
MTSKNDSPKYGKINSPRELKNNTGLFKTEYPSNTNNINQIYPSVPNQHNYNHFSQFQYPNPYIMYSPSAREYRGEQQRPDNYGPTKINQYRDNNNKRQPSSNITNSHNIHKTSNNHNILSDTSRVGVFLPISNINNNSAANTHNATNNYVTNNRYNNNNRERTPHHQYPTPFYNSYDNMKTPPTTTTGNSRKQTFHRSSYSYDNFMDKNHSQNQNNYSNNLQGPKKPFLNNSLYYKNEKKYRDNSDRQISNSLGSRYYSILHDAEDSDNEETEDINENKNLDESVNLNHNSNFLNPERDKQTRRERYNRGSIIHPKNFNQTNTNNVYNSDTFNNSNNFNSNNFNSTFGSFNNFNNFTKSPNREQKQMLGLQPPFSPNWGSYPFNPSNDYANNRQFPFPVPLTNLYSPGYFGGMYNPANSPQNNIYRDQKPNTPSYYKEKFDSKGSKPVSGNLGFTGGNDYFDNKSYYGAVEGNDDQIGTDEEKVKGVRNGIDDEDDALESTETLMLFNEEKYVDPERLFVGNIPFTSEANSLIAFFEDNSSGVKLKELKLQQQPNGLSKGFAIVICFKPSDATFLIKEFNNVEFEGRELTVRFDKLPKLIARSHKLQQFQKLFQGPFQYNNRFTGQFSNNYPDKNNNYLNNNYHNNSNSSLNESETSTSTYGSYSKVQNADFESNSYYPAGTPYPIYGYVPAGGYNYYGNPDNINRGNTGYQHSFKEGDENSISPMHLYPPSFMMPPPSQPPQLLGVQPQNMSSLSQSPESMKYQQTLFSHSQKQSPKSNMHIPMSYNQQHTSMLNYSPGGLYTPPSPLFNQFGPNIPQHLSPIDSTPSGGSLGDGLYYYNYFPSSDPASMDNITVRFNNSLKLATDADEKSENRSESGSGSGSEIGSRSSTNEEPEEHTSNLYTYKRDSGNEAERPSINEKSINRKETVSKEEDKEINASDTSLNLRQNSKTSVLA